MKHSFVSGDAVSAFCLANYQGLAEQLSTSVQRVRCLCGPPYIYVVVGGCGVDCCAHFTDFVSYQLQAMHLRVVLYARWIKREIYSGGGESSCNFSLHRRANITFATTLQSTGYSSVVVGVGAKLGMSQ